MSNASGVGPLDFQNKATVAVIAATLLLSIPASIAELAVVASRELKRRIAKECVAWRAFFSIDIEHHDGDQGE